MTKILYIGLSFDWTTLERSLLLDITLANNKGYDVTLYCLRDSFIDLKVKNWPNVKKIYHTGKIRFSFLKWYRISKIKEIIKKNSITIVHCYDLNHVWPMAFFLKSRPQIVLFLTINREVLKKYTLFFHHFLISRIDQIFIPISSIEKNMRNQLKVLPKKITALGIGASEKKEIPFNESREETEEILSSENFYLIGHTISLHHEQVENIRPLIYAILGAQMKNGTDKSPRLILHSEQPWNRRVIYSPLKKIIEEVNAQDCVIFFTSEDVQTLVSSIDVWLPSIEDCLLEDYSLMALLAGRPILAPRHHVYMELIRPYGSIGETYKKDDPRQLRDQLYQILNNYKHYQRQIERSKDSLKKSFGIGPYSEQLIHSYEHFERLRKRALRPR